MRDVIVTLLCWGAIAALAIGVLAIFLGIAIAFGNS